ncbi:MAG TPA: flagellar basal body rod protein FlgC [Pirellulaceae bacterium]|jgi:flagellar basal-body rod protein FlgC|nr:flagellar basal body rod protein FlgC [Pirellulaceae bacterium]
MIPALDISTSALVAQRIRLDTVSSNLANLTSMERDEKGNMQPYQARYVIFQTDDALETKQGAVGVKVASVQTEQVEPLYRWQPAHPYAIKDGPKKGYVAYPRVNMTAEMVDALVATRAYEANIGAMELSKNMAQQSLRILG